MTCEDVQLTLPIFLYGELSCAEEEALERHLEQCAECQAEQARLHRVNAALAESHRLPSLELLSQCRRELRGCLEMEAARPAPWWKRLVPAGAFWRPAGALALMAVGFAVARLSLPDIVEAPSRSHVSTLKTLPDGNVRIVVEETRQRVLSGSAEDREIEKLLLSATEHPSSPAVRARSVELLQSRGDREIVRKALLRSLQEDSSEMVRMQALEALRPHAGDAAVRQALAQALLSDADATVRSAIFDLLVRTQNGGVELAGVLQELMEREQDDVLRERGRSALRAMNASVGTF